MGEFPTGTGQDFSTQRHNGQQSGHTGLDLINCSCPVSDMSADVRVSGLSDRCTSLEVWVSSQVHLLTLSHVCLSSLRWGLCARSGFKKEESVAFRCSSGSSVQVYK